MGQGTWGSATESQKSGGGDPNILKLGEQTKIRVLDPTGPRRWRQHAIQHPEDDQQFTSVVCPKGPDGDQPGYCPLCAKPSYLDDDGKEVQRFGISKRYATNVLDYESGEVKVLLGGPQIFKQFDGDASVGLDPTASDYIIFKMGKGISTSYRVTRTGTIENTTQFGPDDLHDLDKYEAVPTEEKVFETLERFGIDWDSLEVPSFTYEQALAFQMPYGKHRGMTVEQLFAAEPDYMQYLYNAKRDQGQYGDTVFQAFHTVLLAQDMTTEIEDMPKAPPRAATPAAPPASAPEAAADVARPTPEPGMVQLVNTASGEVQSFPESAASALIASGGFEIYVPTPDPVPEPSPAAQRPAPADDELAEFEVNGVAVSLKFGDAKTMLGNGVTVTAKDAFVQKHLSGTPEPEAVPEPEPIPDLPSESDEIVINVGGVQVPMAWIQARALIQNGQAEAVEPEVIAAIQAHGLRIGPPIATAATPQSSDSTETPTEATSLDPALTFQAENGEFAHPAMPEGKTYKTKGAVTQWLKRQASEQPTATAAPAVAPSAPAAAAAPGNGGAPAGESDLMNRVKGKLEQMPELHKDFKQLVALFGEVAPSKRAITDFDEGELTALEAKLDEKIAAKE